LPKKKKSNEEPGMGWIVRYADLMTLLFAVFVVLYGLKPEGISDTISKPVIAAAIRNAFTTTPDIIPDDRTLKPTVSKKQMFQFYRGDTPREPVLKKFLKHENVINVINKGSQQVKALIKMRSRNNPKFRQKQKQDNVVSVKKGKDGFKIRLLGSYFFQKGSYRVARESFGVLRDIGKLLNEMERNIVVEGHTDNAELSGDLTNWELSSLRASHVLRFLIQETKLPAKRGTVAGYADTKPVADNTTEEGRKLNRRVEIKVKYGE